MTNYDSFLLDGERIRAHSTENSYKRTILYINSFCRLWSWTTLFLLSKHNNNSWNDKSITFRKAYASPVFYWYLWRSSEGPSGYHHTRRFDLSPIRWIHASIADGLFPVPVWRTRGIVNRGRRRATFCPSNRLAAFQTWPRAVKCCPNMYRKFKTFADTQYTKPFRAYGLIRCRNGTTGGFRKTEFSESYRLGLASFICMRTTLLSTVGRKSYGQVYRLKKKPSKITKINRWNETFTLSSDASLVFDSRPSKKPYRRDRISL